MRPSLLQCFIFHVSRHPKYPDFEQCVTFDSGINETTYTIFCILGMYFIPLVIICWAYTKILCEITSKSRESDPGEQVDNFFISQKTRGPLNLQSVQQE